MAVGKVSDADFEAEVLKAQGPVVVDFWPSRIPLTLPAPRLRLLHPTLPRLR